MIKYIMLPDVDFSKLRLLPHYRQWLVDWLKNIEGEVEDGVISTSLCVQGVLAEILIYGECQTDWNGILQAYLENDLGEPLAYSKKFGEKLYRFNQWEQSPIHAIHAHWWVEKLTGASKKDLDAYSQLIKELVQPSGWIYNPEVSKTNPRTRMKSELMMSLAMGIEILTYHDSVVDKKKLFEALLSSVPMTGYLSAEYFRLKALDYLGMIQLAPSNVSHVITMCEVGEGFCDFSVASKVDDYMGTAKRVSRDKALHSAISSLHANHVATRCSSDIVEMVNSKLHTFCKHLLSRPFDIQAFRMRDIDVPFGTDVSALEVMGASYIVSNWKD